MGNSQAQPPERAFCDLGAPGTEAMLAVQLYLIPAFFLGVLILGLPLNLLSLWVFSLRLRRWSRSSALLFNLALADASWLLALPVLVSYQLGGLRWGLGPGCCRALRLLYHNYFYLNILFVTCVSVDRYLAIVHPLRSLAVMGRRRTQFLCAAVWAVTLLLSLPVAGMAGTQRCPGDDNRTICAMYAMLEEPWGGSLPYSLSSSVTGFLLPLAAIGYCCLRSVKELRRLPPRLPLPRCRWRRLARDMMAALALFAALYLPYHLARNAVVAVRAAHPDDPAAWRPVDMAFSLEMCLCSLNACANPLFSCFVGPQFRREALDAVVGLFGPRRCRRRRLGGAAAAAAAPKAEQRAVGRGARVTPL